MNRIINFLETTLTFLVVKIFWKKQNKKIETIRSFQATESDGVWHLFRGIKKEKDPAKRATLFSHVLEEQSHADLFAIVYQKESGQPFTPETVVRKDVVKQDEASWKNLAYVHIGEVEAVRRFNKIIRFLGHGPLKKTLSSIVADESGHVDLTYDLLQDMDAPSHQKIRNELKRIQLTRFWEAWMRSGGRVIDHILTIFLSTLYFFVFGPFLVWGSRKKINQKFVSYDNNYIKEANI